MKIYTIRSFCTRFIKHFEKYRAKKTSDASPNITQKNPTLASKKILCIFDFDFDFLFFLFLFFYPDTGLCFSMFLGSPVALYYSGGIFPCLYSETALNRVFGDYFFVNS